MVATVYTCYDYTPNLGILAEMRPCGMIVLLAELYSSESKSQVYAHLHEFLRINATVSQTLG